MAVRVIDFEQPLHPYTCALCVKNAKSEPSPMAVCAFAFEKFLQPYTCALRVTNAKCWTLDPGPTASYTSTLRDV